MQKDRVGVFANSKMTSASTTTNDGGVDVLNNGISTVLSDFTTDDGVQRIQFGDRVLLPDGYSNGGTGGRAYQYMGVETSLDLATQDYSDLGYWKIVAETQLIPEENNITPSDSIGVGGIVVRNDLRGSTDAYVDQVSLTVGTLDISALEEATLKATVDSAVSSSGGSAFGVGTSLAVNGAIATNTVLSQVNAFAANSTITAQVGDVTLDAQNRSSIDAITKSATTSNNIAVGATLAFNTIGWEPQNLLFDSIDALAGYGHRHRTPRQCPGLPVEC